MIMWQNRTTHVFDRGLQMLSNSSASGLVKCSLLGVMVISVMCIISSIIIIISSSNSSGTITSTIMLVISIHTILEFNNQHIVQLCDVCISEYVLIISIIMIIAINIMDRR